MVAELTSFALTLGEETFWSSKAERPPSAPLVPLPSDPQQLTAFHPIAFDPHFRSFLAGDKILVDWKTHALTFAGYKVGGL